MSDNNLPTDSKIKSLGQKSSSVFFLNFPILFLIIQNFLNIIYIYLSPGFLGHWIEVTRTRDMAASLGLLKRRHGPTDDLEVDLNPNRPGELN